ncbi:MAG: NAD(P)/FAD-dependent oxidoreductase [Syntrophomonadaceae bacterium]|nr:NAD(P)/FAD-dependent oxidoreductase [Syntrophomonadaceae bacterium]
MATSDLPEQGGVLQKAPPFQESKHLAIIPHLPVGIITPDILRKIADIAEKYEAKAIKITSAQQIIILGIHQKNLDAVWADLDMAPTYPFGLRVKSIKACPGENYCKKGFQDALSLAQKIDELYFGREMPGKIKIGVSGCPNCCAESNLRDIGLVGNKKGYKLMVGGCGGANPRIGEVIFQDLNEQQVLEKIDKIISFYAANAEKKERIGRFVERVGMEGFLRSI